MQPISISCDLRHRVALLLASLSLLAACGGAEARKERYLEKAESLIAEQNFEKAQLELRNAMQIAPDDVEAKVMMGRVSERTGNPAAAVQMYRAALDLDETSLAARTGLARLYAMGGLPDEAMKLVEPGLVASPDDSGLLTVRAVSKARLGDFEGANDDVRHALRSDPSNENAIALLAALYGRESKNEDAIELLENGIEALPRSVDLRLVLAQLYAEGERTVDAERLLREVMALQPDAAEHRYRLVRFYVAGDEIDKAERILRDGVAARPDDLEAKKALVGFLASRRSFEAGESEFLALVAAAPRDTELRLALGDFYAAAGKSEQSVRVYQALVADDGTGAQGLAARNRLAAAAMRDKRLDEATRLIGEVLAENPQDNDALIMRADIALAGGDTSGAITDLRAVLRDQPASVSVQRALARAYLERGDLALAEDTLRAAARNNPTDASLRIDLAQVLARAGAPDQAEQALQDLVDGSPQALDAQNALFRIQFGRGDLAAARATAASVKAARPDLPLGDFLTGLVSRAEGKLEDAAQSYDSALRLQPDAAEPLTALVELMLSQKQPERALARLDDVIEQQDKNAVARTLRGEVLVALKRNEQALVDFDAAIALAPRWWVPYRGKSLAERNSSRTEDAIRSLEQGLAATMGAAPLASDLAALFEQLGRPDDAIRTYERIHAQSPKDDVVANNLAMLLVTYRQDERSLEKARQLSERFATSDVPAFLNTNGWVKFNLGQYSEAIPVLQRAADRAPDSPVMRYHLAMAQYKAGQREDARKNLEAALEPGIQFSGIDVARATLAELRRS